MNNNDTDFFQNRFLPRIRMYIQPINKDTVVAFIYGYEQGRSQTCSFSEEMSMLLQDKHRIVKRAMGWPEQLQRYADKKGVDWIEAFQQISGDLMKSGT
jgi:hypothetical protein